MGELATFLERFGLKGIVLTVIGALCIWGLAHWSAAPGQPVSVLWGLVEYTKRVEPPQPEPLPAPQIRPTNSTSAQAAERLTTKPQASPTPPPQPIDLFVRYGLSPAAAKQLREALRAERQLRSLSSAEDGRDITEIPSGTYFYTLSAWLETDDREPLVSRLKSLEAARLSDGAGWIEVHHQKPDELQLLACTDEVSASRAAHLSGSAIVDLAVAATCSDDFSSMLSIPVDRVRRARPRYVRSRAGSSVVVDLALE